MTYNRSKRSLLPFQTVLIVLGLMATMTNKSMAQFYEVGGGLGTFLYQGELAATYNPTYASPAAKAMIRFNLNTASVLNISLMAGTIKGNATDQSNRMVKNFNQSSFSSPLVELSTTYEYNFFDYRKYKSRRRGTPYIMGGFAGFLFFPNPVEPNGKVSPVQVSVPFGVGYKYALTRTLNLGAEATFRKTFTSYLDNSADFIPNDPNTQQFNRKGDPPQRGYKLNNDWYMFAGVTLTYTFYSVPCPFPEYW